MKRHKQIRMTRQRQVILDELRKVTSHPTAEEILQMVRPKLPTISLGTIYRSLEILADAGIVLKLQSQGGKCRFDGNAENHYHIRCIECGKVDDIHQMQILDLEDHAKELTDYEIYTHILEFQGLCPGCRNNGKI
jgi:Fur family ferric uptake transcriptional regulator